MNLEVGDNLSGEGIQTGKYLGKEEAHGKCFYKIFDASKNITVFIPEGEEQKLRKLPTSDTVKKHIKIFASKEIIDDQEIEDSRYKYFKEKVAKVQFKKTLEVYHDLTVLQAEKRITPLERRLMYTLKEKLVAEISFVLGADVKTTESLLTLTQ